eukprot:10992699-Karenia_brevis.AAC.1
MRANALPKEALPILNMISVMAKHSQHMEYQQEMQRGALDQHHMMISKIEEAINESAIRINGFFGEAFNLTPKSRRQTISSG